MLRHTTGMLVTFMVMMFCVAVEQVGAQAFCGLRDPVRSIYKVYPEADAYRSIVRAVDANSREAVGKRLPFTLHFNELGKHTLYVALKDGEPLGLVRSRSEKGRWGLVEIAWSLDVDLKVREFYYQRCRDQSRMVLEKEAFKSQIIGKDFKALRRMLSKDGQSLNKDNISVSPENEALALTTLRSALKTIAMTDIVWSADIRPLQAMKQAKTAFPNARTVTEVDEIYTANVYQALQAIEQAGDSIVQRDTVELYLAFDKEERLQGSIMKTECVLAKQPMVLWWAVTPDHRIYRVKPVQAWPGEEYEKVFGDLEGMTEQDIHQCSTAAQVVGAEVLVVSGSHITG